MKPANVETETGEAICIEPGIVGALVLCRSENFPDSVSNHSWLTNLLPRPLLQDQIRIVEELAKPKNRFAGSKSYYKQKKIARVERKVCCFDLS